MRVCARCKQNFPLENFCKDGRRPNGRGSYCSPCANARAKEWLNRDNNLEVHKIAVANWSSANPEKREAYRQSSKSNKDESQYYLSKFNISKLEYGILLESQDGCCFICRKINATGRRLSVDHDHKCCNEAGKSCGKCIRGLLCHTCNLFLGRINDDLEAIERLRKYLNG